MTRFAKAIVLPAAAVLTASTTPTVPPAEGRVVNSYDFSDASQGRAGTSGTPGVQTLNVKGNPSQPGLYTIVLRVAPNTKIAAHTHRDDRTAVVIRGDWAIGYGRKFDGSRLQTVQVGGFYTEPPMAPHFARAGRRGATVMITGFGPTNTLFSHQGD